MGRYLSAGGVDPDGADGIGERGLWGMNGTSESSKEGCDEACASCLELLRPKLLMKSVKPGFDNNGVAVAPGGRAGGRGCVDKSLGDNKLFSGSIPPSSSKKKGGRVKSMRDGENEGVSRGCSEKSISG